MLTISKPVKAFLSGKTAIGEVKLHHHSTANMQQLTSAAEQKFQGLNPLEFSELLKSQKLKPSLDTQLLEMYPSCATTFGECRADKLLKTKKDQWLLPVRQTTLINGKLQTFTYHMDLTQLLKETPLLEDKIKAMTEAFDFSNFPTLLKNQGVLDADIPDIVKGLAETSKWGKLIEAAKDAKP